ncbi:MAG: c-type cytochrome [Rhodospirillales bacterium]|nr:c-type cytochrome [Rhodospirillales bacterium]
MRLFQNDSRTDVRIALFVVAAFLSSVSVSHADGFASKQQLGEALFFDTNLSKNKTQACATCHNPEYAFTDPRETAAGRAVSLGDDGKSLGNRNTPTAAYAMFSPAFHQNKDGAYVGGQFLDGREKDLAGQAGGPPVNPVEMGMPNKESVVGRIKENTDYVTAFKSIFGDDVFEDEARAYLAMTDSIAAFEQTAIFAPFDSKYDRYLRGEAKLTDQEELGQVLFFSKQFTNCNQCHQLRPLQPAKDETFTNYHYHNIGVPANKSALVAGGHDPNQIDHGLLENPDVKDKSADGKFKVPTLRNVAVTGPYMHNGVFNDLRTTILFYNKYNARSEASQINPETGKKWREPEVPATLSTKELTHGPALDDKRIDALVAFLKTLTDKRYEHLMTE